MPKTQRACYELGQQLKEEGNNFFKQGNYAEAVKKYAKVRAFLRSMMPTEGGADNSQFLNMIGAAGPEEGKLTQEETKEAIQLQASTFLNLSICYFKMQEFRKSLDRATESLNLK